MNHFYVPQIKTNLFRICIAFAMSFLMIQFANAQWESFATDPDFYSIAASSERVSVSSTAEWQLEFDAVGTLDAPRDLILEITLPADVGDLNSVRPISGSDWELVGSEWQQAGTQLYVHLSSSNPDAHEVGLWLETTASLLPTRMSELSSGIVVVEILEGFRTVSGEGEPVFWPNPSAATLQAELPQGYDRVCVVGNDATVWIDQSVAGSAALDLSTVPPGSYQLVCSGPGKPVVRKLITHTN